MSPQMVRAPRPNKGLASGGVDDGGSQQAHLLRSRRRKEKGVLGLKALGRRKGLSMMDHSEPKSYLRLHLLNATH